MNKQITILMSDIESILKKLKELIDMYFGKKGGFRLINNQRKENYNTYWIDRKAVLTTVP